MVVMPQSYPSTNVVVTNISFIEDACLVQQMESKAGGSTQHSFI